ncbi:STAS domain-containing protein [Prauserella flavalba]|uniref:STAS domain-containing protein n=1 Tax=Prauserella flavalba TaxID=1477506 RepID=A0A318LQ96_9PSEU|nr:STAS domain-containing protein [Prauserella flavalba]PXY35710.1 hypothetical protein BA062_09440 [Prauserella flavalba]
MTSPSSLLTIHVADVAGCLVVRPEGELTAGTYSGLRDTLVRCAVEEPDAVVVELDRLWFASDASATALTSAYACIAEWPAVPLSVVVRDQARHRWIRSTSIDRFLAVFPDLESALAAVGTPPPRRRAVAAVSSGALARRFAEGVLRRWNAAGLAYDAKLVVTELVENTMRHTVSDPVVRLESWQDRVTVAVADDDPAPAVLHERADGASRCSGLRLVARVARAWGSAPASGGGKVVWATLRVP